MTGKTLAERINALEFDTVFRLYPDGTIEELRNVWAPSVFHDDDTDIDMCGAESEWRALTGFTGQDRYHGAVMHASEFIGQGIADYMMEMAQDEPVTFTTVVVECWPEDDDDEPDPAGWAILYRTVES